jgi:hypothetical protein
MCNQTGSMAINLWRNSIIWGISGNSELFSDSDRKSNVSGLIRESKLSMDADLER